LTLRDRERLRDPLQDEGALMDAHSRDRMCAVAPSPQLRERLKDAVRSARVATGLPADGPGSLLREPRRLGFNDGVLRPPSAFGPGADRSTVRAAAHARAPMRGQVRVLVVLVDFSDKQFSVDTARFEELFFWTGSLVTGSVKEYFTDVSGGLVEIVGEVVGPLRMQETMEWYANGNFGIGNPSGDPRAQFLAQSAAREADGVSDLRPYDNDGDGYVDAFVVVHAGRGGEETGDPGDLWSHKWVLPQEYEADGTKVFAYLTIPEDAKLGVSAHELGHLLFGFPDLYDTDYTSAGIGDWCLMAGGSWNAGGDVPAHPSAWCKAQQGWVTVDNVTADGPVALADVKDSRTVHRMWTGGAKGQEYFLLEHRRRPGYDRECPARGCSCGTSTTRRRTTPTSSTTSSGCCRPTGCASSSRTSTAGTAATATPGRRTTGCSAARRRRRRGPTPTRTPASSSRASRWRTTSSRPPCRCRARCRRTVAVRSRTATPPSWSAPSSSCRRRSSACRRPWPRPGAP
jgi:immune inhibitor A